MSTRVRLDSGVRRYDDGRVLLGGAPARLIRLSAAGAALVDSWLAGDSVGDRPGVRALVSRLTDNGFLHPVTDPATDTKADVTLVVPVRDNPTGLARLRSATADVPRQIVVDDGSVEPVPESTVRLRDSRGPAAARNLGWRRAETSLIAFLDSDTVPAPGWLDELLPLFADPAVAAVAPRITTIPAGRVGRYEAVRSALDMGAEPASVRPDGRVRYVPSAALVVRAAALHAIGGFDDSLRFGEDVDLVWRLRKAGYTVRYHPAVTVAHEPRTTVRAFARQRFQYGTSAAALAHRHPEYLPALQFTPLTAAEFGLALTGKPVAALAIGAVASIRTVLRLRAGGVPIPTAGTYAVRSQLSLSRHLGQALRRAWWPAALTSRRGRQWLGLAVVVAVTENLGRGCDPVLGLIDDLAYSCGVWAGCLRQRTLIPLLPVIRRAR